MPNTLRLLGLAIPLAMLGSLLIIVLGWLVHLAREVPVLGSLLKRLGQMGVTTGISIPVSLLGLLLIYLFALEAGWLPAGGWASPSFGGHFDPKHAVLPVLTLALLPGCLVGRSVLGEIVYLGAAEGWRGPLLTHGVLTYMRHGVMQLVGMLGGALLVEVVFSLPGIGRVFVEALYTGDLLVVMALAFVFLILALILRAIADLLQGIDGFVLLKLSSSAPNDVAPTPQEKTRYGRGLGWIWIAVCLLLVIVPLLQGTVGLLGGEDAILEFSPGDANAPPGSVSADGTTHPWGADRLGRDIRSRARYAQGLSLWSSLLTMGVILIPALLAGLLAAFLANKGTVWADLLGDVVMFPVELFSSMTGLILLAFILALQGQGLSNLLLWLGLAFLLPRSVRMVRDWWLARPAERISWQRLAGIALGVVVLGTGLAVSTQAALNFLGLGATPPQPSLGGMMAQGMQYLTMNPSLLLRSGRVLFFSIFGWYLLADTLASKSGIHRREAWLELNR